MRPCPFTALDVSIRYAEGFVGKKLSSTSNADGCVTDGMEVVVQLYDGQPFSAKVPARVTCSVIEAEPYFKGQTATPTCVWSIPFSPFFCLLLYLTLYEQFAEKYSRWVEDLFSKLNLCSI